MTTQTNTTVTTTTTTDISATLAKLSKRTPDLRPHQWVSSRGTILPDRPPRGSEVVWIVSGGPGPVESWIKTPGSPSYGFVRALRLGVILTEVMTILEKIGKDKALLLLAAFGVLIVPSACALTLVGVAMSVNDIEMQDTDAVAEPPPIVTLAEFEQIETQMSYQEVVDLIGAPGIEGDAGDNETRVHVWQNSDASHMRATFRNGQLINKAQLYLR